MRIVIPVVLLVAGLVAGWIGRGYVSAPPDVPSSSAYEDWHLICPAPSAKGNCILASTVAPNGQQIANIELGKAKNGLEMVVTAPFDVLLQAGMGLAIGKDKIRVYPYETCNTVGCIATVQVDDQLLASMRSAKDAKILIMAPNNKPVAVPFSMNGFTAAHDALTTFEARRNSWWRRLWS